MPAHARGVLAAEVAQVAAELDATAVVDVTHVALDVRLVHALVVAEVALEDGGARVHTAGELRVTLQ